MLRRKISSVFFLTTVAFFSSPLFAGPQAQNLGIPSGLHPRGKKNQITDVRGVRVGHLTLNIGQGKLDVGKGPVRTGVTVIVPADGDLWTSKVRGGSFVLNGNGEATGLMWLQESGRIEAPIALTNTLDISTVQKALAKWTLKKHPEVSSLMPIVLECDDSSLNDIHGEHVKTDHVFDAIKSAKEKFDEGSVGAGAGMISFDFKSGIGSASRLVRIKNPGTEKERVYTLGVLVNSNIGTGTRNIFRLVGIPIAEEIRDLMPIENEWNLRSTGAGSINIVIATDAEMDSRQLNRLAIRSFFGLARLGAVGYNGSGEVAVAFSTVNRIPAKPNTQVIQSNFLDDVSQNDFFEAVVEATEEAVINSLLAAEDMTGRDKNTVFALPKTRLQELLRKYRVITK